MMDPEEREPRPHCFIEGESPQANHHDVRPRREARYGAEEKQTKIRRKGGVDMSVQDDEHSNRESKESKESKELGERLQRLSEQDWLRWLATQEPGTALRAMRLKREMTQEEVAEYAEISAGYLSHLEHRRTGDPRSVSRDALLAIANGLSAPPSEFNIILERFNFAGYAHTRRGHAQPRKGSHQETLIHGRFMDE